MGEDEVFESLLFSGVTKEASVAGAPWGNDSRGLRYCWLSDCCCSLQILSGFSRGPRTSDFWLEKNSSWVKSGRLGPAEPLAGVRRHWFGQGVRIGGKKCGCPLETAIVITGEWSYLRSV